MILELNDTIQKRDEITKETETRIKNLYKEVSEQLEKEIAYLENNKGAESTAFRSTYVKALKKRVDRELYKVGLDTKTILEQATKNMAQVVVDGSSELLKQIGLGSGISIGAVFSHVPEDIVRNITSGNLYEGNWTLSSAIWKDVKSNQKSIEDIITKGIIANAPTLDIAKDLEKFVNPNAALPWDWSKVYPGVKKQIDYNAQRLARTMISHAYTQSTIQTTINNPFITKYKWNSSNSGRTCPICQARDGQLFDKGDVPLDHPNGMCTLLMVTEDYDKITDRLANWVTNEDGSDPELDKFAKQIGYTKSDAAKNAVESVVGSAKKTLEEVFKTIAAKEDDYLDAYFSNAVHGDAVGQMLASDIGYDATPTLVDTLTGDTTFYRGLVGDNVKQYLEEFKTGEYFFGRGIYGNGTYVAYGDTGLTEATKYANGNEDNVLQMGFKSDAKIGDFKELFMEKRAYLESMRGKLTDAQEIVVSDVGRYAMLQGYDGYVVNGEYAVVLNRGALEVVK